ncbi:MAG TPA: aspartyl/asparaginyl beta-hydroxylase domain-containing protein [Acidobacteriaceae bacterium]|jgi:hypothetical protein
MSFEPARLHEDLARIPEEVWTEHFNQNDYQGRWSSVSLRSLSGRSNDISAPGAEADAFRETPLMEQCPYLQAVVRTFEFPLRAVRLLRLQAGSRVREHIDADLGLAGGELRIHVPMATNDQLEFVVANRQLKLREGEAWYVDFSQPHRIHNGGETDRVHLVIDGQVNDWALALLERSAKEIVTETCEPRGIAEFRAFRERVYEDAELQSNLEPILHTPELLQAVVDAGQARGYNFGLDEVESVYRENRREWKARVVPL